MRREKFSASVIAAFQCEHGKKQTIFSDAKTPGLGVRVTCTGTKSYIFESRLFGKTLRITIGRVQSWPLRKAQAEAARLKVSVDQGIDPRQVTAAKIIATEAASHARKAQKVRDIVTVIMAWSEYVAERKPFWGARHYDDHIDVIHTGGEKRARSNKFTEPGVLASLATIKLINLTPDRVTEWAKVEGIKRAGRARLATRLLKAFLTWCGEHKIYGNIIIGNPAKNKKAREQLGRPEKLLDVLQKQQLSAWFAAIKQISNPVISAYLQALLLTGRRPNEIASLRWVDLDFQWENITVGDKSEGFQIIPLTPYLAHLLNSLPRRNAFVFSSPTAINGYLVDPHVAFKKACAVASVDITIYGLRRSFATLSEWVEMPAGIAAQIQGHKPSGIREKHYIRRPLDLLRVWHVKIESWILEQAGIELTGSAELSLKSVK